MNKIIFLLVICPLLVIGQDYKNLEGLQFKGSLSAPEGFEINPGQIEKNGNFYALPIIDTNGKAFIYRYAVKKNGKTSLDKMIEVGTLNDRVFSGQVSLNDNNQIMVFTMNFDETWSNNDLCISEYDANANKFKNVRLLGEVNEIDVAEAYSYLSGDALRLYFIQDDQVFFTSRQELKFTFKFPQQIEIQSAPENIISCWLTHDELTIYLMANSIVYKAVRPSRSEKFGEAKEYITAFQAAGFISGFCMSESSKLIFVYYSPDDGEQEMILIYKVKK